MPILYAEIISFFSANSAVIRKYEFTESDSTKAYLELIYEMFKLFYTEKKDDYKSIKISTIPEFFTDEKYQVNLNNVSDVDVIKIVKNNRIFMSLLKIFLNLFKKKRTDKDNFINANLLQYQHEMYELIQKRISVFKQVNENYKAATFLKFLELTSNGATQYDFNTEEMYPDVDISTEVETIDEEETSEIEQVYNKELDFWVHLRDNTNDYKNSRDNVSLVLGSFPIFIDGFQNYLENDIKNDVYFYNLCKDVYKDPNLFKHIHKLFCVNNNKSITKEILDTTLSITKIHKLLQENKRISVIYVPEDTKSYYIKIFSYYRLIDKQYFTDDLKIREIPNDYYMDNHSEIYDLINSTSLKEFSDLLDPTIKHLEFEIVNQIKK
jgi:hypothetical protein